MTTLFHKRQAGLSTMVLILCILIAMLLAAGAVGGLYMAGMIGGDADAEEVAPQRRPALYREIDPAITVNLTRDGVPEAVLQVRLQVMTREEGTLEGVGKHMPMIRNNLIMLYSNQRADELTTRDGKDALREQSRDEINQILADEEVNGEIEAVFFTSFVMQ